MVSLGHEWKTTVNADGGAPVVNGASPEPTLEELAERLVELREHLERTVRSLNDVVSGGRGRDLQSEESSLCCYACRRIGSTEEPGWTLRLCGDDELHPFCPDCDRRHVNGDGPDGQHAESAQPAMHHPVPPRETLSR